MRVTEYRHIDRRVIIVVFDSTRLVVKDRPVPNGYLIVGYGICLLDKKPSPTVKNQFGQIDPTRYFVRSLSEAREIVKRISESG